MITDAALYLATPQDTWVAAAVVAGRPLAFRTLMAAVRAGCRRIYVPAALRGGPLEAAVATSPSARAAVVWLEAGGAPPPGPLLLLPAGALLPSAALVPLVAAPGTAVLAACGDSDAPVAVAGPALTRELWGAVCAGRPLGDALGRALRRDTAAAADGGWYVRVASVRAAADAEARLYGELGSPVDTRLDTLVHRRLSRPVSRLAVHWGITPNQVTLLSLVAGLGAAGCFWHATPGGTLVGLALYVVAVVLDHADGEIARLTLSESPFGARLDVAVDTAVHAMIMVALGVTAQDVAGGGAALAGFVAALGAVAAAGLTQTSTPVGIGVGTFLDALSNRDGFYAMLLAFIAGLAFLPNALPALMWLVAGGCHAFWLSGLVYRLARRVKTARKPK